MAQRVGSIPVKKAGHRTSGDTSVRAGPGVSGFWKYVRGSLTLKTLGLAAVGFLLGRGSILGLLSPFGAAYYSALKAGGVRHLALVLGAVVAGSAYRPGPSLAESALVLVAIHVVFSFLGLDRDKPGILAALASSAITLTTGVAFQLTGPAGEYGYLVSAFEAFLTGLLTLVFLHGILSVEGEKDRAPSGEETLSTVLLITAAVAGLAGIEVGSLHLELQNIAGGLVVIALAQAGGSGLGATAGAILGVVTSLSDSLSPAGVGVYAFAGLLAGIFRELGKPGVGAGYFLGSVMLSLYLDQVGQLNRAMLEAGIAAAVFLLVPSTLVKTIRQALSDQVSREERPSGDQVARDFLTRRIRELAQVFRELSRAFDQVASSEQRKDDKDMTKICEAISSRVCQSCAMYKTCWTNDLFRTYNLMSEVWAIAEAAGSLSVKQIPEEFRKRCIHPAEVAASVNYIYDLQRVNFWWEKRIRESREIVSAQLKGVSHIMEGLSEEVVDRIRTAPAPSEAEGPHLEVATGVAKLAKKGSLVSGDSYLVRRLDDHRLILALSDGMGAGPRASLESRATISLLEQLLATGFESDMAVRTVNSILLLRSPEEMFATVDLAVIDLRGGEAEFTKIGAAPSFVRRRNDVTVIKTASLPAGILNQIEIEPTRKVLKPGDTLVMVTDGLWDLKKDEADKERWIVEYLQSTSGTDPQALAESFLARALEGADRDNADDMMVMVARIESQSGASKAIHATPAQAEWSRARPAPKKAARPRRTDVNL